jgi:3-oxoadipate enol-lactonase
MAYAAPGTPTLRWREHGQRLSDAIVLLHSLGTDAGIWQDQAMALSVDHRVVVPDARGHGASDWAPPVTLDVWVNDVDRIFDAAGIESAVLVGLSMGGIQALAYALERPHRLHGLVLADTFAGLDPDVAAAKVDQLAGTAERDGMAALADAYVADTFTRPVAASAIARVRDPIAAMRPEAYVGSAQACFGVRLADRLGEVRVPTLVLWGAHDAKAPRALSEQIADGIPDAALVEIPDAGHLSNLENPHAFTRTLSAFANRRRRAKPALRAARR